MVPIANSYLEDSNFGFDTALVLKSISDEELNVPKPVCSIEGRISTVAGRHVCSVAGSRTTILIPRFAHALFILAGFCALREQVANQ
jgi:hypothetical protein